MISWIDNFDIGNLKFPCAIDKDSEYAVALKDKYGIFIDSLKAAKADKESIDIVERYSESVMSAVQMYYRGELRNALDEIQKLIHESAKDTYVVTGVKDCPAYAWDDNSEVQFFRARLSDSVKDFPAEEMLHVPFDERHKLRSQRFSVSGLPCLYLGNTSYDCWLELGSPAEHRLNVSPVILDDTLSLFNLCVTFYDLKHKNNDEEHDFTIEQVRGTLKSLVLMVATSFVVKQENRNFKSEYIVSQLIMLACKNEGIDGVTYYSKRVSNDLFAIVAGINVALFAPYDNEEKLSKICRYIKVGDSFNFSMFRQLRPSLTYKQYSMKVNNSPYINNIGSMSRQIPYKETEFYEFDKYLFANWNKRESVMKPDNEDS